MLKPSKKLAAKKPAKRKLSTATMAKELIGRMPKGRYKELSAPDDAAEPDANLIVLRTSAAEVVVDEGFNQRTDWGDIGALALSIAERGVEQPGRCRVSPDGLFHLVDGERRLKALRMAIELDLLDADEPKARFPYLLCDPDDAKCRELMLLLNSGKPFTFLENARTYAQIVTGKGEWTMEAVARRNNISSTQVRNYMDFFALVAPEVQAATEAGECTPTLALDLAHAVPDKAEQWEIYQDARQYAREGLGEDAAAEARVTARHLSVPTGKSPGRYGGPKILGPGVPFRDVKSDADTANPWAGTSHDGRMGTHEKIVVEFPKQTAAHGAVLIGTIRLGEEEKRSGGEDAVDADTLKQCVGIIFDEGRVSTSLLQRRLRLGFIRACSIVEALEERGIISIAPKGATERTILKTLPEALTLAESSPSLPVSESPGLSYRVGIEARWPAMRKEDGRLRELPRVDDKPYPLLKDAILGGLIQLRGELEAKDFNDTMKISGAARRTLAVEHLTRFIEKFTELTGTGFGTDLALQLSARAAKEGNHVTPDANSTPPQSSVGSEGHDEQSEDSEEEEQAAPTPKPAAKAAHANHGVTPTQVLSCIEETMTALGKECDQDATSVACYVAYACMGRYPLAEFQKSLRVMLSK